MDKYEYKVRAEEIKALIKQGQYAEAAEIADTIDWRRIKSVMMLCTISDLYKINKRYEDARDMLLLAYDRHPGGRSICYSLCELSIKMEEFPQAVEYYKEFVQVAPRDSGRYILQYRMYQAQNVNLEERITVLEELKKRDYRERWAYELAYLYHCIGEETRCVEECDELILWFGDGKYVIKALELKMLHAPLTPQQQSKYDNRFNVPEEPVYEETEVQEEQQEEEQLEEQQAEQNEVLESLHEEEAEDTEPTYSETVEEISSDAPTRIYDETYKQSVEAALADTEQEEQEEQEELDIQVKTVDVSQYNTINLQKELAEGLKEVLGEGGLDEMAPKQQEDDWNEEEVKEEVFFGETGELQDTAEDWPEEAVEEAAEDWQEEAVEEAAEDWQEEAIEEAAEDWQEEAIGEAAEDWQEEAIEEAAEDWQEEAIEEIVKDWKEDILQDASANEEGETTRIEEPITGVTAMSSNVQQYDLPPELAEVLTMDGDGQIRLLVEEDELTEEQIDGQITLEDVLSGRFQAEMEEGESENLGEFEFEELEEVAELENSGSDEVVAEEETAEEEPEEETAEETEEIAGETAEETEEIEEETAEEPDETGEKEPEETVEEVETTKAEATKDRESKEEAEKEEAEEVQSEEKPGVERDKEHVRDLTPEEQELFGAFLQNKSDRNMMVKSLDKISMAAYTGNVIVTGDEGMDTFSLCKNVVRYMQLADTNFSGKTAKISGANLNSESVSKVLEQFKNGALIIHKASELNQKAVDDMYKLLQQESLGIIVILEDNKRSMNKFLTKNEKLAELFNARIDLQALNDDALVDYGKRYAEEQEYSIDDLGILALHTRIHDMQSSDHAVTVMEVKEIIDGAIKKANRKNMKHLFDVLLAKRYDEEDMIILREKDFIS